MDLAKGYSDAARGLNGFLDLEPLLNSIQLVLNDYLPAVCLIAFALLVVGAIREFLSPETRRFMQTLLRFVLLVALIGFLPNTIEWCDRAIYAASLLSGVSEAFSSGANGLLGNRVFTNNSALGLSALQGGVINPAAGGHKACWTGLPIRLRRE
jgi:hypothetical protein